MRSRETLSGYIRKNFRIQVLPDALHSYVYQVLSDILLVKNPTRSELARNIFLEQSLGFLKPLPHKTIAAFLKVSPSVISRASQEAETRPELGVEREGGRPTLMSDEHFEELLAWLRQRCDE
jgi:hypothetical protein